MFIINGCDRLCGEIKISGAKNAALPLLAASILTKDTVTLHNCPMITDVLDMKDILTELGAEVEICGNTVSICAREICTCAMPEELSHKIRSSIFMLGSMLGRKKEACFFMPGGCEIGKRPIDMHISALEKLGVATELKDGRILCRTNGLRGGEVSLLYPSVGATENIILAAAMAEGVTVIRNAAREPEIYCLAEMINSMGGAVYGAGTSVIYINGVKTLHGTEFTCIPDRIEAGTYLCAAAAVGGEIVLHGVVSQHFNVLVNILEQCGCGIKRYDDALRVTAKRRMRSFSVKTAPYPGFPTDLQAQMCALACTCEGESCITETVFENRLKHTLDFERIGASVLREGDTVYITGSSALKGAEYYAHDLRAGAAFIITALAAEGKSVIRNTALIDRGYECPEKKFSVLGADIIRV